MSNMSLPTPGFTLRDVLPFVGAAVTGLLGFFGAQFTAVARLQKTLLDASRALVEEAQKVHAQDGVLISEARAAQTLAEAEVHRYRGVVDGMIAEKEARIRVMERLGFTADGHPIGGSGV